MKLFRIFSIIYQIVYAIGQVIWAVKEIFAIFDDEETDENKKEKD